MVRGYVDILDHRSIIGWVAGEGEAGGNRFVSVHVDGVELGSIRANFFRPDLRDAGISDGYSGFCFLFPSTPNPLVDHVIEVRDRGTGTPLIPCPATLESVTHSSRESMLSFDSSFAATHIRSATFDHGVWNVEAELIGPERLVFEPNVRNGTMEVLDQRATSDVFLGKFGICRQGAVLRLEAAQGESVIFLDLLKDPLSAGESEPACHITLPADVPAYLNHISAENMIRVAGPHITRDLFAASGVNTAYRLDSLVRHHLGTGLEEFENILDWGIGPGRVALPIKQTIAPRARISGSDVDEYNVDFGRAHYPDIEFLQSPFFPPLPYKDHCFDFAYGISVVTHLTEGAQFAWLKELHRVVKPGALVVLTVHGEYAILDVSKHDATILPRVSAHGISDQMIDTILGPKLRDKTYYRATFHARRYVAQEWGEYFDVIAHYPCANGVIQDFVVLRAK